MTLSPDVEMLAEFQLRADSARSGSALNVRYFRHSRRSAFDRFPPKD